MVEKILISPDRLRCYGNVIGEHSLEDYELNKSILVKMTDTVDGVLQTVYQFGYTLYGFIFGVDTGLKELYVQTENTGLFRACPCPARRARRESRASPARSS